MTWASKTLMDAKPGPSARRPPGPAMVRGVAFVVIAAMASGCWWRRRGPSRPDEHREYNHEDHRR
jgi:hypothetical protein